MVVQKTINNLKERPEEDKKVIAGGIAIAVVTILLVGWFFLFLKKIQSGEQKLELGGGIPSEFNFTSLEEIQNQLQGYSDTDRELREIRDASASGQVETVQQTAPQEMEGSGNQFDPGSNQ